MCPNGGGGNRVPNGPEPSGRRLARGLKRPTTIGRWSFAQLLGRLGLFLHALFNIRVDRGVNCINALVDVRNTICILRARKSNTKGSLRPTSGYGFGISSTSQYCTCPCVYGTTSRVNPFASSLRLDDTSALISALLVVRAARQGKTASGQLAHSGRLGFVFRLPRPVVLVAFVNVSQNSFHVMLKPPLREMTLKTSNVAYVPNMIALPVLFNVFPG